ncbi:hypothetical protein EYC80_006003 [Monilinia laxa]|uniref:Uncharacterized protein n=1 Tax=Monilinia laxa TaxID=61186 RepID=A0A5N6KG50_MONLA|nr:hypothetical protein EYC80_006003 [Monilinia laxa]
MPGLCHQKRFSKIQIYVAKRIQYDESPVDSLKAFEEAGDHEHKGQCPGMTMYRSWGPFAHCRSLLPSMEVPK